MTQKEFFKFYDQFSRTLYNPLISSTETDISATINSKIYTTKSGKRFYYIGEGNREFRCIIDNKKIWNDYLSGRIEVMPSDYQSKKKFKGFLKQVNGSGEFEIYNIDKDEYVSVNWENLELKPLFYTYREIKNAIISSRGV